MPVFLSVNLWLRCTVVNCDSRVYVWKISCCCSSDGQHCVDHQICRSASSGIYPHMSGSCNCMVKKLHSCQTKPTDKDGGLEASRSYKDLVKSSPAWRMTGGKRVEREKSENQRWRRKTSGVARGRGKRIEVEGFLWRRKRGGVQD